MQSTFLCFILAATAVTLYTLAGTVVWGRYFDGPWLAGASAYQWSVGVVMIFLFVSLMGGLLVAGEIHEWRSRAGKSSFFARMGFFVAFMWGIQPVGNGLFDGDLGMDALVSFALRTASVAGASCIFYLTALKRTEAEAA